MHLSHAVRSYISTGDAWLTVWESFLSPSCMVLQPSFHPRIFHLHMHYSDKMCIDLQKGWVSE